MSGGNHQGRRAVIIRESCRVFWRDKDRVREVKQSTKYKSENGVLCAGRGGREEAREKLDLQKHSPSLLENHTRLLNPYYCKSPYRVYIIRAQGIKTVTITSAPAGT